MPNPNRDISSDIGSHGIGGRLDTGVRFSAVAISGQIVVATASSLSVKQQLRRVKHVS